MASGKELIFTFVIDKNDYRDTMMCITFGSQKWKRIALLSAWIFAAAIFVANLLHLVTLSTTMYTCCLMVMVAIGGVFISAEISIYKYKKVYAKGKGLKRRIVVNDKGMIFRNLTDNSEGFTPWEEIYRVQETRTTYVIGVGNVDAIILPKRALLTNKDVRDFEGMVQEHIHGRFMPM